MKKWQNESDINAELRKLTHEVRALRDEIRQDRLGRERDREERSLAPDEVSTSRPVDDERKLRLFPHARRRHDLS
jgi:hypothetical protein